VYPYDIMAEPRTPRKFTPDKRTLYLKALEATGEVSPSASAVGVSRQCIYDTMEHDPEFRDACEQAQGKLDARLMATVEKLALKGMVTVKYDKNGKVASRRRSFDTRMVIAWLKRRDRAAWGDQLAVDKRVTGTVIHEQRIRVEDMTPQQLRAARAFVETLPRVGQGADDMGKAGAVRVLGDEGTATDLPHAIGHLDTLAQDVPGEGSE